MGKNASRRSKATRAGSGPGQASASPPDATRWVVPIAALVGVALLAVVILAGRPGGPRPLAVLRTNDFHALAFRPDNPDVVYFGHHNGVMRSDDGGRTWRPVIERPNFDAMGLAVSRADPQVLYLAGHDILQVSRDGGATWEPIAHDLPGTDVHGFALAPGDPERLYAFVVGHGLFRSENGGRNWERLTGNVPGDVTSLTAASGNPPVLYAGSASAGVLRSADGGRSWSPLAGLASGTALALATDPAAAQTVYAAVDGTLYKSTDGGTTWSRLAVPRGMVVSLAVSPARPGRVLTVTVDGRQGLVYRSEDGGATWGQSKP